MNVATSASVTLDLRCRKLDEITFTQRSAGTNLLESLDELLQDLDATSLKLAGQKCSSLIILRLGQPVNTRWNQSQRQHSHRTSSPAPHRHPT